MNNTDKLGSISFEFDGETWTSEKVMENRKSLIEVRDAALTQGAMEWALHLSLSVMLLGKLAELMIEMQRMSVEWTAGSVVQPVVAPDDKRWELGATVAKACADQLRKAIE